MVKITLNNIYTIITIGNISKLLSPSWIYYISVFDIHISFRS